MCSGENRIVNLKGRRMRKPALHPSGRCQGRGHRASRKCRLPLQQPQGPERTELKHVAAGRTLVSVSHDLGEGREGADDRCMCERQPEMVSDSGLLSTRGS